MNKELFLEYHEILKQYKEANKNYQNALDKKAELFYNTQPGAVKVKDIVHHISPTSDKYLNYSADLQIIESELENARNILGVRELQLKLKEKELRESKEIKDIIYLMYYIEKRKVKHICYKTNYGKSRVYKLIDEIKKILKK